MNLRIFSPTFRSEVFAGRDNRLWFISQYGRMKLLIFIANIVSMPVKILTALTAKPYIIFIHKLMFFLLRPFFELKRNGSISSFRNSPKVM